MFKLTLKNLVAKKVRLALTTLAVMSGVVFVVAVFVVTDSLRSSFASLSDDIAGGSDLTIRAPLEFGEELDRALIPEDLVSMVETVDGVHSAVAGVFANNVVITDDDGDAIVPLAPTLGMNYSNEQFFLVEGREPQSASEFAVDSTTVSDNDMVVGNTYTVDGPFDQRSFELVGVFNFGAEDRNASLGQTMSAFELSTAQEFFGFGSQVMQIDVVVADGADRGEVRDEIAASVGADYEVVTSEVIREETGESFDEFLDPFSYSLLTFAFITAFVSAFIINNTFQIVVGQRIRELGLLRALGATGRQVSQSVVLEGVLIGAFSTTLGVVLGWPLGGALRALMNAMGFAFPSGELELRLRTIVVAVFIGMGVTLASSIVPSRRARSISPMAALQGATRLGGASLRRRLSVGSVVTVGGAVSLWFGLFGDLDTAPLLLAIGAGALLVFVGVYILSPVLARPVARAVGRPIAAMFGVPGQLSRENAARTPRRTASTAGALMIGLALVGMSTVVAASIRESLDETLGTAVTADYFIQRANSGFDPTVGFSNQVADELEQLDELESVVRYRFALQSIEVAGSLKNVFSTEFATVGDHMDPELIAGSFAGADPLTSIMLHEDPAADLGVGVGDTIDVTFIDGATDTLTVAAIYENSTIFDNWTIDLELWDAHFNRGDVAFASATIAGFSDDLPDDEKDALLDRSRAAIDAVLDDFPAVTAENRVEFRESRQEALDTVLAIIIVFLVLSLFIALVGIMNTLALSVFERTREIGLVRAVGMTRRQLRKSIRWEAAIIAAFGGLLGMGLGVVFGVAATRAIPDTVIRTTTVPVAQLVIMLVFAVLAGLVAALIPAWRASRLNVLEAIAHE